MRILIIEDELPAQIQLERLIQSFFPKSDIVAKIDSVKASVSWLEKNHADLIFMDVELSDGQCFEIFKQVSIDTPIIITTAYSDYAIKAFKVNSIDYLLKPIDDGEFVQAVEKSIRYNQKERFDFRNMERLLIQNTTKEYKKRLTIKIGDHIHILNMDEIAYFYSEEKATFVVTNADKRYILDYSLDSLDDQLNPKDFFRVSRGCVVNIKSVQSASKFFNSRLKIKLNLPMKKDILVSRARVSEFLKWLEGL
ncbi:MAG: LytTR family DNA-binding domain-containing protein [Bacteroidales bacterium]|jgi:DNA-binding LytR/AlgR family response regulator|nr:LytTR family DNA-binding domain-containing protein [Bacteroidales bacterium]